MTGTEMTLTIDEEIVATARFGKHSAPDSRGAGHARGQLVRAAFDGQPQHGRLDLTPHGDSSTECLEPLPPHRSAARPLACLVVPARSPRQQAPPAVRAARGTGSSHAWTRNVPPMIGAVMRRAGWWTSRLVPGALVPCGDPPRSDRSWRTHRSQDENASLD
jgi:hypothetical protein